MKQCFWLAAVGLWIGASTAAQTNRPVTMAIVPESAQAATATDLLTVELSRDSRLRLLERSEIDRVYREQGLSAANRDLLKLGQVLGADGLLLLESIPEGTNGAASASASRRDTQRLTGRLLAVSPGVVLAVQRISVAPAELPEWAAAFSRHLNRFLPKLSILAKDAVPISVVNLRCAIASAGAAEVEEQLKAITIQRLSWEPRMFVLERQRMDLLSEEKALKADASSFWSGSYLLEGVVDRNGFARDTVTVNARLTPSRGGPAMTFEISGPRTNLAQVAELLAGKVAERLQIASTKSSWVPTEEALQYFSEAQWALRWKIYAAAKAAAESAWALGKRDSACALLRIKVLVEEISATVGTYQSGESSISSGFNAEGKPLGPTPSDAQAERLVREILAKNKSARISKISSRPGTRIVSYTYPTKAPLAENIDEAIRSLTLYEQFCRTSPDATLAVETRGRGWNDWHNSEWYQLGIETLEAASRVLQGFHLAPGARKPVEDKLAELRALARSVAERISAAPSVRESYFVGARVATHDELGHTLQEHDSIFRSKLRWGGYWQEKPEDHLALYRDLLASPAFCYLHGDFWAPRPPASHLIAWKDADTKRVAVLWHDFVNELDGSTNVLLRMESKALRRADALTEAETRAEEADWWSLVRSNREELIAHNVELFYLGWGFAQNAETEAMDREYWDKAVPARNTANAFEQQKRYLASFTPYDFAGFNSTFRQRNYTKAQAAELLPLVAAYKSNLLARLPATASRPERFRAEGNARWVESFLAQPLTRVLNPPAPAPAAAPIVAKPSTPVPSPVSQSPTPANSAGAFSAENSALESTNILFVRKFLPIPIDGLPGNNISQMIITAHHWLEGKLVLDVQYGAVDYLLDEKGGWKGSRWVSFPAIAILDPKTESWQVIACPEANILTRNLFYHRTALFRGEVFSCNGGSLKKYDAVKKSWQVLDLPEVGNCELFSVYGRLYAATPTLIVELLEGGTRTHTLASNRRRPPASTLDSEPLGIPALFAGPGRTLRALAANRISVWSGTDWHAVASAPNASLPPTVLDEGVLFLADGRNGAPGIWRLAQEADTLEFCMGAAQEGGARGSAGSREISSPRWKLPAGISWRGLASTLRGPDLLLMVDRARSENIVNQKQHLIVGVRILPQNGCHAEVFCFGTNYSAAQRILLRFNAEDTTLPISGEKSRGFTGLGSPSPWLLGASNCLFCGRESANAFPSGGQPPGVQPPQTGVWMIPLEQLDHEISSQREAMRKGRDRSRLRP